MKTHCFLSAQLCCFSAGVLAGESANYSITQQSQNTGARSTSTNFTLDSSSASGGTATSAAFSQRGGFAGALFDPVALRITASPAELNESTSRQLTASLLLDDASVLNLSPGEVSWSVLSGPLSFNVPGTVTAGSVFDDSDGEVRGAWQALNDTLDLTVLNVSSDNFGSYGGDGLDDAWQVLHFGTDSANAGPLLDPDSDGWTNLFEYNAGLIPTDPLSVFSLSLEPVAGQPEQRRVRFSPRLSGRTYTVLSSTTMQTGTWVPVSGDISDSGEVRTVTDPDSGGTRKYYRVEIQKP
jgi:hypothetical protein